MMVLNEMTVIDAIVSKLKGQDTQEVQLLDKSIKEAKLVIDLSYNDNTTESEDIKKDIN